MNPQPKKPKKPKRNWSKYRKLQRAVLDRDRNRCLCCGQWTEAPPHHDPFLSQNGQDTLAGMHTVCPSCHWLIHNKYGSMAKTRKAVNPDASELPF